MSEAMVAIDLEQLQRLVAEKPDEFRRLLKDAASLNDRFGRSIHKYDKVITPAGEDGKVIRLDIGTKRVLIELPTGRTRLLMAHRVEVRRGRPRKDSLKTA